MRILRTLCAVAAVTVATVALAAPAFAHAAPDPTDPASYDFSDCPTLPAGLDPAAWRCEVHLATGEITIGRNRVSGIPLRLVHAEGPLPDGTTGQIFGTLQSRPMFVPRGDAGDHRLTVQVRYAGYADLVGNGPDPGGLYLMLAVRGPGLGSHCTIGTPDGPIRTHAARVGATTTIPTDPPIKQFTLKDTAFSVPSATTCDAHGRLDARFGLPATAGNTLTLQAAYTYRMYSSASRVDT
jgi:hypothetical protein